MVSSRMDGSWTNTQVFNFESDWTSLAVDPYGRTWVAAHIGASDDLWVFDARGFGGNGLELDTDQDGFTGYDEHQCGTDPTDPSSVPADFDMDGRCDQIDDLVDLPASENLPSLPWGTRSAARSRPATRSSAGA